MTREHNINQVCLNLAILILIFSFNNHHFVMADRMGKLRELHNHTIEIASRQFLEYGDECSSEEAAYMEYAAKASEEMSKIRSISAMETALDNLNAANKKFLSTYRHLCNSSKLLSCDKAVNRCDCGPRRVLNHEYVYVRNSHGDCLWSENSPCFAMIQPPSKHNICANNTNCTFKSLKGENIDCNERNVFEAVTSGLTKEVPQCFCKREFDIEGHKTTSNLNTRNSNAEIETQQTSKKSNMRNSDAEIRTQQTSNALNMGNVGVSNGFCVLALWICILSLCFYT